ncbi:MAG: tRNA guanosine(34) transglycosylase Tgt [Candidatus Staskawiczbacteria bacterium]|nr:tRNA guanosine(34) transglycosylase Tgt [Candidatus Staskawiczbacteria bacterium]
MNFKILKKSKISRARLGFLETEHGVVETPCLVPVATQAVVKTLDSKEVEETKSQILISNTFWLHLRPGEKVVEKAGKLHKFMNWKKPLMTDSGGYQVFSLGFGRDFGLGSKLALGNEIFSRLDPSADGAHSSRKNLLPRAMEIKAGAQPQNLIINSDGVVFRSPINGDELFLGPKESIKIQEKLGADIIFAFDECTPPMADFDYVKKSLEKTHNWAKICLKAKKTKQALYGIVQGSRFKDLRVESAKFIGGLNFDGFGIGGEFGNSKKEMSQMLQWVADELPEKKPRHLLGVGYLEDMEAIIKSGVDTFDCTVPTHYARRGIAFTSEGKLNLKQTKFLKKIEPLDKNCVCNVCLNYKKDYICHLLKAGEITGMKLLTFHNLWYFNTFVEEIRNKIKKGEI